MGTQLFNRHTAWTVFFSLLVALGLGACSDVSNAPAPAAGPAALTITTDTTLPNGSVNIAYTTTLAAVGGRQPYGWSIVGGGQPALGLTMNSDGVISGTPTNTGSTTRTYRVVDSSQPTQSFEKALTIAINAVPQPQISQPANLPNGIIGTAYSATLTASGGTPPYTNWEITPPLPAGLIFTPSGDTATITGIPQAGTANTTNHTFRVIDSFSPTPQSGTRNYDLTISNAPVKLLISTLALPPGTVSQAYSHQLVSTGGTGNVTWSLSSSTPNPILPGLSLSAGGLLSGSPTLPAVPSYTMRFRVQDSAFPSDTDEKNLTITTGLPAAPNITTTSLPNGSFNSAYDQPLQLTGGTAPLTWGVISGALPNGLGINAQTGRISGTASQTGPFLFTVQVTDSIQQSDTQALSITISTPTPPQITTSSLPVGTVTQSYPATVLQASGGTPPLTWDPVVSPALPNGLSWNAATHTITGIPLNGSQGTSSHTFTVRDTTNPILTATKLLSLTINLPAPPNITTTNASLLPNGTATQAYSRVLQATGGTGALTWSIALGTLPTGLSLNQSSGEISGIPSTPGTFNFTPAVIDTLSQTDTTPPSLSMTIGLPAPPNITTTTVPSGTFNQDYSQPLAVTAGTPPFIWSLSSGTPPAGLTLGTDGVISGTPTGVGNSNFTVQVTDALSQTDTQPLSLTIVPPGPPTVTTTSLPNGVVGAAYSQILQHTGGTAPFTWTLEGTLPDGLTLGTDGTISGIPTTIGPSSFTVRITDTFLQSDTQALTVMID